MKVVSDTVSGAMRTCLILSFNIKYFNLLIYNYCINNYLIKRGLLALPTIESKYVRHAAERTSSELQNWDYH
jgi:hypothetical protein